MNPMNPKTEMQLVQIRSELRQIELLSEIGDPDALEKSRRLPAMVDQLIRLVMLDCGLDMSTDEAESRIESALEDETRALAFMEEALDSEIQGYVRDVLDCPHSINSSVLISQLLEKGKTFQSRSLYDIVCEIVKDGLHSGEIDKSIAESTGYLTAYVAVKLDQYKHNACIVELMRQGTQSALQIIMQMVELLPS